MGIIGSDIPNDLISFIWVCRARVENLKGNDSTAEECFQKATDVDPRKTLVCFSL